MEHYVPQDIVDGLAAARRKPKDRRHRLRIEVDGAVYPVLSVRPGGFTVAIEDCPQLRGFVDLFDGSRHLANCLVMCATESDGTMQYEYKRMTKAQSKGALDFETEETAPVGYLAKA